jgi:O-antigen/teichoic acid export membrane protein
MLLEFLNSSLFTATQRFLNYEMGKNNEKRLSDIFSTSIISHYIIAFMIVLLAETVGLWFLYNQLVIPESRFNAAVWVFHFSVFTFFVNIISSPYTAMLIAYERMNIYAYISMADVLFKLAIVYFLTCISFDKLALYAVLLFISSIIMRAVCAFYCKKSFGECRFKFIWDKDLLKKMFSFSGWMFAGTITNTISYQGVTVLMNIFFGPILNSARAISQQISAAVNSFASNFIMAVRPQIIKSYSYGNETYMYKLVFTASKISFYLLFVLALPVLLQTEYLLILWLKIVPEYSVLFTQLSIVEILISSSYTPIAAVSQASGKIKYYQLIISIGFLLIFILTLLLYELGLPAHTAYSVAIAMAFIGLIARLLELKKTVKFPMRKYLSEVTVRLLAVIILSVLLPLLYTYHTEPSLIHFIYMVIICVISVTLSFWLLGLNTFEKRFILKELKQKLIKK